MKDAAENFKKSFCFLHNSIWSGCCKLCLLQREHFSSAVNVWTNSAKMIDMTNRDIFEARFSQSNEKIWKKLLWRRFQQCLGPFHMLTLLDFSEMELLRRLRNLIVRCLQFHKSIRYEAHLFFKCLKLNVDFIKAAKKWEKFLVS